MAPPTGHRKLTGCYEILYDISMAHEQLGNVEAGQPTVLEVLPGRVLQEFEKHAGQPAAFFVRTEGTEDTLVTPTGSLDNMVQELFGKEALDFISGMNSPEEMKNAAEEIKAKLNNPEFQARIRKIYTEVQEVKDELYSD